MKVLLFGATGMVGQGVLRECLNDPRVESVRVVGRSKLFKTHPKLSHIVEKNLFDLSAHVTELTGYDACFFCLGVSVAGLSEAAYSRLTYDLTVSVAQTLARLNPAMTFTYVSGTGTDSTESGKVMWARVKGKTENALLALPFKAVYLFRPGIIRPMDGIVSKTFAYRAFYFVAAPFLPLAHKLAPNSMTTTRQMGRAMIAVVDHGAPKKFLENADINAL